MIACLTFNKFSTGDKDIEYQINCVRECYVQHHKKTLVCKVMSVANIPTQTHLLSKNNIYNYKKLCRIKNPLNIIIHSFN